MSDQKGSCTACGPEAAPVSPGKRVVQPQKRALLNRMRRVEGQLAGIGAMIDEDRYCVDILTQISAVKSALDGVATEILASHAQGCVRKAVAEDGGEAAMGELIDVIRRLLRKG